MVELYAVALAILGVIVLGAAVLPRLLAGRALSFPILYVGFGIAVFSVPNGLPAIDPIEYGVLVERSTELGVIIALMGAGLKLDRPPSLSGWISTWRLLAISMPLTIAAAAVLGWWVIGLAPAAALLLGAVIAPTDPVLASEVQVGEPRDALEDAEGEPDDYEEPEVRFALTSEAGLNDGLAFPFTYLAVAVAVAGLHPGSWIVEWLLIDVVYKIATGTIIGAGLGWLLATFLFRFPIETNLADAMEGSIALGITLFVYGITELAGGYGFIAVFVAALAFRHYERTHESHEALHDFIDSTERLLMAVLLVLFGGAIAGGLLAPLTVEAMTVGLVLVLVVRPLAGAIGLLGFGLDWYERGTISFFGIRGVGSFYYLAYGLNQATFPGADIVWATVGFTVGLSVVVHGITASPVMNTLERWQTSTPSAAD